MVHDHDKMQQSIDDLTEWQDNQYNPGYWIGGITPNNLLTPRKPKIIGWFLILTALGLFIPFIFLLMASTDEWSGMILIQRFLYIAQMTLLGGLAILLLIGGILKIFRNSGRRQPRDSQS